MLDADQVLSIQNVHMASFIIQNGHMASFIIYGGTLRHIFAKYEKVDKFTKHHALLQWISHE